MSLCIAFFGSSLVSTYWNGAATYYRGILRALAERGHAITFYEPDAFDRQQNRDIEDPPWARVVVYPATSEGLHRSLQDAQGADLLVKASGVGVFDAELEAAVLETRTGSTLAVFWDVDAPATLDRLKGDPNDPLRRLVPRYDAVFTYGGGPRVVQEYQRLGARACVPIYNALDPSTHHPVAADSRFECDLGFLGNRLPDRERRVEQFFLDAAARLPERRFLLGGSGWHDKSMPSNVRYLGHVSSRDHNAFNVTPLAVLNISRDSMASYGFSPATRVFEAAGAGSCIITDEWQGLEQFLEPNREVLVARDGEEVAQRLSDLTSSDARAMGERARQRMLRDHTYAHRALDVERALDAHATTRSASVSGVSPRAGLRIVVLGLSITSSWGNGHATTYRALIRALHDRGHQVTFLERDVPWYAQNRDLPNAPYVEVALYQDLSELKQRFGDAVASADLVIVGSYVPDGIEVGNWVTQRAKGVTAFYDIDTPITLAKLEEGSLPYLSRELVARYDLYLSFTGGPTLERLERHYGARRAVPLYCSVDPELYYPEAIQRPWTLGYMGTYSSDRQPGLEQLLFAPAERCPELRFVVAGPSYPDDTAWPKNVEHIPHLPPAEHRRFYNSMSFTLNLTRQDMKQAGFSPSVRLFEAAACGVPIISDRWEGIESLFEPGREILLAQEPTHVLQYLKQYGDEERLELGARARARVLEKHTSSHRAAELEAYVQQAWSRVPVRVALAASLS